MPLDPSDHMIKHSVLLCLILEQEYYLERHSFLEKVPLATEKKNEAKFEVVR